jgi:hypothetical protein
VLGGSQGTKGAWQVSAGPKKQIHKEITIRKALAKTRTNALRFLSDILSEYYGSAGA